MYYLEVSWKCPWLSYLHQMGSLTGTYHCCAWNVDFKDKSSILHSIRQRFQGRFKTSKLAQIRFVCLPSILPGTFCSLTWGYIHIKLKTNVKPSMAFVYSKSSLGIGGIGFRKIFTKMWGFFRTDHMWGYTLLCRIHGCAWAWAHVSKFKKLGFFQFSRQCLSVKYKPWW